MAGQQLSKSVSERAPHVKPQILTLKVDLSFASSATNFEDIISLASATPGTKKKPPSKAKAAPTPPSLPKSKIKVHDLLRHTSGLSKNITGEIISNDVNGLLVRPADPDAMAGAIFRLADHPELAERLARRAFDDVEAYSWRRRAERVSAVLEAAVRA